MNNPQQPREYDAVLGGNSPSLESAAVLGGIEGVKLRLKNPDVQVRIAALEQALSYGEEGLDLVITGLNDEDWDVKETAYLLLQSSNETRVQESLKKAEIYLINEGVTADYTCLRNLLADGNWKAADEETKKLMSQVQPEENPGVPYPYSINWFPCKHLQFMDKLWVKYSNGRFGFSVQNKILKSLGTIENYNFEMWDNFGREVGWKKNNRMDWLKYEDIIFDLKAPPGHLPLPNFQLIGASLFALYNKGYVLMFVSFFYCLENCGI